MSLVQRFREGDVPEVLGLNGAYRVHLLTALLPPLRFFLHRKLFLAGQEGAAITGVNEFMGPVRIARFRVGRGPSLSDPTLEVARIIYDDPRNPFLVRPLVDEIRQVGPEHWLGQGFYPIAGKPRRIMWFRVQR